MNLNLILCLTNLGVDNEGNSPILCMFGVCEQVILTLWQWKCLFQIMILLLIIAANLLPVGEGSVRCGRCFCTGQKIICRSAITLTPDSIPNGDKVTVIDLRGSYGEVELKNLSALFTNLQVLDVRDRDCQDYFYEQYSFEILSDCVTTTSDTPNISRTRKIMKIKIKHVTTTEGIATTDIQNSTIDNQSEDTGHSTGFFVGVGLVSTIVILIPIMISFICCCWCDKPTNRGITSLSRKKSDAERLRKRYFESEIPMNTLPMNSNVETLSADSLVLFKQE